MRERRRGGLRGNVSFERCLGALCAVTSRIVFAPLFLASALWACGGEEPVTPSGAGGSTASAGGASTTTTSGGGGMMGVGGSTSSAGGAGGAAPTGLPIVAGVGWQGLRVLSIDEGQTWCEVGIMVDGHDDLFRGGGYHDGLWVGAHAGLNNNGAIWTSTNGYDWQALHATNEEPNLAPSPTGQWFGGAAYGNGRWVAVGGCGRIAISTDDGVSWTQGPKFGMGCTHMRSLVFRDGYFVAGADDDNWHRSTDGETWEVFQTGAGSVVLNLDSGLSGPVDGRQYHQGRGVCLAGTGSPNFKIVRSTEADCSGAVEVADTPARVTTFSFGHAPEADFTRAALGDTLADCLGVP